MGSGAANSAKRMFRFAVEDGLHLAPRNSRGVHPPPLSALIRNAATGSVALGVALRERHALGNNERGDAMATKVPDGEAHGAEVLEEVISISSPEGAEPSTWTRMPRPPPRLGNLIPAIDTLTKSPTAPVVEHSAQLKKRGAAVNAHASAKENNTSTSVNISNSICTQALRIIDVGQTSLHSHADPGAVRIRTREQRGTSSVS